MLLGIILAGGQSRRMGFDKALLPWQGGTLLTHAQQLLIDVGCDHVLVSRNEPDYIEDHFHGQGPLAGIHACLSHTVCDEAIVIPVDMPLLSQACLNTLISQGRLLKNSCHYSVSVMPSYLAHYHDLVAISRHRLEHEQRSITGFMRAMSATIIDHPQHIDKHFFINTNTYEQWAHAKQLKNL